MDTEQRPLVRGFQPDFRWDEVPHLPYKQDGNADKEDGVAGGRVLVGLPEAIGGEDARHLLVPLASGLLLFVFAMHAFYVSRRAAVEAPLDVDE